MISMTKYARIYIGMTQTEFCKKVNLTQPDLCELENNPDPFGKMDKYFRVAEYLDIPLDTLLRNDFSSIPDHSFLRFPRPEFLPVPTKTEEARTGREGEEFIFAREVARLREQAPALARLVLPFFKMTVTPSPGFDILSFDEAGTPFALEVKTCQSANEAFRLSSHEYKTALKLQKLGHTYRFALTTCFGTDRQKTCDLSFDEMLRSYNIRSSIYLCSKKMPDRELPGIAYFRCLRGLQQKDLAQQLDIPAHALCRMENGKQPMNAPLCLKASDILGVTVDELLATYSPDGVVISDE